MATPVPLFLPGKSHGQKNLVGSSPWGCRVGHDLATEHALTVLHDPGWVESRNAELQMQRNHGYRGLTISYTWIFDCKEGSAPLNPSCPRVKCI